MSKNFAHIGDELRLEIVSFIIISGIYLWQQIEFKLIWIKVAGNLKPGMLFIYALTLSTNSKFWEFSLGGMANLDLSKGPLCAAYLKTGLNTQC